MRECFEKNDIALEKIFDTRKYLEDFEDVYQILDNLCFLLHVDFMTGFLIREILKKTKYFCPNIF